MPILLDNRSALLNRSTGWERYTRSLSDAASSSPNVELLNVAAESLPRRIISDNVTLPRFSRSYRYVHFPTYPPSLMFPVDRSVVTVHDLTWWKTPEKSSTLGRRYYLPNMRRAVREGAALVTVSEAMRIEMEQEFDRQVWVVPNSVSLDRVPPDRRVADERRRPYLVTVGSVEPRKNLARLAQAFAASGLSDAIDLVLVGRSAWGELPRGVDHVGALTDGELRALLEGSLGLVSASTYEGFGLPVAEAVALGVPVACSDITAHREAGRVGSVEFFDPLSVEAITKALRNLAEERTARSAPRNLFDSASVKAALSNLYSALEIDL